MDTTGWFPLFGFLTAGMVAVIALYILLLRFSDWKLPGKAMVNRKKDASLAIGGLLLIIALMGGAVTEMQTWIPSGGGGEAGPGPAEPGEVPSGCPSTGYTAVKMDVQNEINTASLEEFNVSITCIGPGDSVSITDTVNPASATNFVCGDTYTCYITSTAGAAGDGSVVQRILSGSGSIQNGQLVFTAAGAAQSFQLAVDQLGVTQARMWDVKNAAWVYDSGDASATDYETDGATFESTTDNSTAMAIGSSGEAHVQLYFRSTAVDNALNDGRNLLFAIDADSTKWAKPAVKLDGVVLTECKDSLNVNEKIALSGYEYVYCYTGTKAFQQTNEGQLDFDIFALSGVDPGSSDDLQIDIIPRGQKASALDGTTFIQSAYDDSASHTVILQVDDYTIDIS